MRKFKEWMTGKKEEVEWMLFPPLVQENMLPEKQFVLKNNAVAHISLATQADLEAIIQIQEDCYAGQAPWGRIAVLSELNKRTSFFLLCHYASLPIAFIGVSLRPESAHITNIATIPTCQRQGLATFLIQMSAHLAKENGCKWMTLEVRISNEKAKRLYRHLGFVDGRIKRNYYHNNGEDALEMAIALNKLNGYDEQHATK